MLLNNSAKLGRISLKVQSLERMKQFYTKFVGLDLIEENEGVVLLGKDNNVIVELVYQKGISTQRVSYTGLYHLAILVPEPKYLGMLLIHLHNLGFNIDGAGDHDFSEALYFTDPEGNGIEIYADRDRAQWKRDANGQLLAVSLPVDIQKLLELAEGQTWTGMPSGTRLGHVHLQVNSIEDATEYYMNTLGFEVQTSVGTAIFGSKNGYHHDFAANIWQGTHIKPLPENVTGLNYVDFFVDNLDNIKTQVAQQATYQYHIEDNYVDVKDLAGITFRFKAN